MTDVLEEAPGEDHVCVGEVATWIWGAEESVRLLLVQSQEVNEVREIKEVKETRGKRKERGEPQRKR
jgi:hypothetical protein